jgi:hypothetical protein
MLKLWLPIILFVSLIIGKCNQTTMNADKKSENQVFLNNDLIDITEESFGTMNNLLIQMIESCDDFYEQLVSNDYVDQIKKTEKCLEIIYIQKFEINVGGRETIMVDRIFIPLTGKFQSNNEVSFFFGLRDYSIHPYANSNGIDKLNEILQILKE